MYYENPLNYNGHIRDDDTRYISHRLEETLTSTVQMLDAMITLSKTNSVIRKHTNSHFHLADNDRIIFHISNQGEITLYRIIFEHHGPPAKMTHLLKMRLQKPFLTSPYHISPSIDRPGAFPSSCQV